MFSLCFLGQQPPELQTPKVATKSWRWKRLLLLNSAAAISRICLHEMQHICAKCSDPVDIQKAPFQLGFKRKYSIPVNWMKQNEKFILSRCSGHHTPATFCIGRHNRSHCDFKIGKRKRRWRIDVGSSGWRAGKVSPSRVRLCNIQLSSARCIV